MNPIIDSIALVNASVVAMSPAVAMGTSYNTTAYNTAMAGMNQVFAQFESYKIQQAATVLNIQKTLIQR